MKPAKERSTRAESRDITPWPFPPQLLKYNRHITLCEFKVYNVLLSYIYICCCSVAKSRMTLCDPMDCSMPGFLVLLPSSRVRSNSSPLYMLQHDYYHNTSYHFHPVTFFVVVVVNLRFTLLVTFKYI